MEKWKKRAVDLVCALAFGGRADQSVVPYYPQKLCVGGAEERFFRRSSPERHGISSKRIYNLLTELEAERRADVHSLMILCDGEVISECSSHGYRTDGWQVSHSMAKTVTGMLVGMACDHGLISPETRLVEIFPEIPYSDKRFPLINIHHLLSMSSGVEFAELGVVTDSDWTATFFSSAVRFIPGSKFAYNSMNSYILARVIERAWGRPFGSVAQERFFAPLGIGNYFWELSPEGTEKGGFGLYMSPESWAKVGWMLMSGGVFLGRRLLSEHWCSLSTETKMTVPERNGGFNYAYHMWCSGSGGEILFNGMLGQNVWICPENSIIAVMTGGNNELFQASPALEILRKHLRDPFGDELCFSDISTLRRREAAFFGARRFVRGCEPGSGLLCLVGLRPKYAFDSAWNGLLGRYDFCENNLSLVPLLIRGMQNNLSSCLSWVGFRREGDGLWLDYSENGQKSSLAIGLYGYESNLVDIRGEKYAVMAMGEAAFSERGEREYRIELVFSETASRRFLSIKQPSFDRIELTMSESPNQKIMEDYATKEASGNQVLAFVMDLLERRLGDRTLSDGIKRAFAPTLIGARVGCDSFESILESERARIAEQLRGARHIRALVDKFFTEADTTELKGGRSPKGKGDTTEEKEGVEKRKNPIESMMERINEIYGK